MESFLSTHAGGSFFCGSNRTVVYHKDSIEFILRYDSPNGKTWGYAHLYMLRNYTELTNYIDIPDMPLDNNDTERLIRDMVMGKKAYLFCRDLDACKRAAMMYSLFGACKVLDKNPERWLCYVLKHIDSTPEDKYYTLLPEFWEDEEQ